MSEDENFTYVLVQQQPDFEIEKTKNLQYQICILWGNNIVHTSHISSNQSFYVGETFDCNYYLPKEKIGTEKLPVIVNNYLMVANNKTTEPVELSLGDKYQFTLSDFTFKVSVDYQAKPILGKHKFSAAIAMFTGFSLLTHSALLASTAMFMPSVEGFENEVSVEQQLLMSQYLASIAEKEEKAVESNSQISVQDSQGGTGSRAKGSEGTMGNSTATSQGKYGIAGPKDNTDPHIAKQKMLQEASQFGLVGLLNASAGGDPNAPTAVWGRDDSLGNDPSSANGSMWGNDIGESFGNNGLSLTGLGESGGGNGEGIGLGNINTIGRGNGTGLDQGFGPGVGKMRGNHNVSAPKLRVGLTDTSGKIPPETIQRIVRQNFGRFKLCYENGLKNNPELNGRVSVKFIIDRGGAAAQASNGGSSLPDAAVVNCVVKSFNGLSFPAPESGIVTVGYSIQFSPK